MVKFIIIKKENLFKCLLLILLIIFIFLISFSFIKKETTTSSLISFDIHNDLKKDFDGDGTIDTLTFDKSGSHYIIKIKTSENLYTLKNNTYGEYLLDIYDTFNIRIEALDLSRDNIPEVIISGYKENNPISYIFKWEDDAFKEVFSSRNNIFGILDSHNSRTPKILHALSEKGDESTESFIFNGKEIKDISFSKSMIPSLGVVQKFIDLIQLDYELTETPGLFTPYIESTELGILWTLSKATYRYSFQTGYFYDINWDKNGIPTSLSWVLSFEKVNSIDSAKPKEEIVFIIKTDIDEFSEYKISSIKKYN